MTTNLFRVNEIQLKLKNRLQNDSFSQKSPSNNQNFGWIGKSKKKLAGCGILSKTCAEKQDLKTLLWTLYKHQHLHQPPSNI